MAQKGLIQNFPHSDAILEFQPFYMVFIFYFIVLLPALTNYIKIMFEGNSNYKVHVIIPIYLKLETNKGRLNKMSATKMKFLLELYQ